MILRRQHVSYVCAQTESTERNLDTWTSGLAAPIFPMGTAPDQPFVAVDRKVCGKIHGPQALN